jgi:predicted short-subunit dehydrogenase-like oxidoreductase (DUF2520 family)
MTNYAIVGGGRLARHFSEYFRLLEIPHNCWARDNGSLINTFNLPDAQQRLRKTVSNADRVLLLISDKSITSLLKQYPFLHTKELIHCSGSLSVPGVVGAHPLMTFTDSLYQLDTYQSVPFIIETGQAFTQLLPGLPNPHFVISAQDKNRYHAMCVMAGNFSQLMWKSISDRFEKQFELPATTLHPYLKQVTENFIQAPKSALTGPLTRNDQQTTDRNSESLAGDPLQDLYAAFFRFYQQENRQGHESQTVQLEQVI